MILLRRSEQFSASRARGPQNITRIMQATLILTPLSKNVSRKPKARRSGCPVSISLEMLGDRWSLLIVRDLMVRGFTTSKEFQESGEGIATNIPADRLQKLEANGIITSARIRSRVFFTRRSRSIA